MLATDRALGILADLEFTKLHLQRIEVDEASDQRITNADDQFDRFDRLHHADDTRQHTEDSSLGAARDHARWRGFGIEAAVAGASEMRSEDSALTIEPEDGSVDVRLFLEDADVVGEVAGREIIRSIDHDVIGRHDGGRILRGEEGVMQVNLHVGVDLLDGVSGTVYLLTTHIARAMQDLALEIREIDRVEID